MTIADEHAIAAVLVRYATAIDRRDWALLRTVFTDDFTGDYDGFGTWASGDAVTAFMEQAHATLGPSLHRISNVAVQTDGDAATAQSYVSALLLPFVAGGEVHTADGTYADRFHRTADGWQLADRRFTMVHFV